MNYCNIKLTILFYKFYYKNQTFKDKFKNTLPRNERNTALLVVMGRPVGKYDLLVQYLRYFHIS